MKPRLLILAGLGAAVLIAYPWVAGRFHVYLATEIMTLAIFGSSFYLLLGLTGFLSFGHAAYFGVGAYTAALMLKHLTGLPVLVVILCGGVGGLVAGAVIGLFLLRLNKIYFSLATVAFGQMLWAVAWKARPITGGDDGLAGWTDRQVHLPLLGSYGLGDWTFLFYLVLALAVIFISVIWLFTRTPMGHTLTCLKSNPERVKFLGINPIWPKLTVFALAGMMAGFSGATYALVKKIVSPNMMDLMMSFDVVILSVLGGYSSFFGPILGSGIYVYLSEVLSSVTDDWQLVMGVIIVLLVMFSPNGFIGVVGGAWSRLRLVRMRHASDT
jgi:branched-chain amino acid transport system permease protein